MCLQSADDIFDHGVVARFPTAQQFGLDLEPLRAKRQWGNAFTDQISFQDCGATLPAGTTCYDATPTLRSYTSFTQAAQENAYSRVLVGFHFRKATDEGTACGRKIGERAATLLPKVQ